MSALLVREPVKTDNFWEHYTDIGHNDSHHNDSTKELDWLWIWVDGRMITEVRPIGYTHSQMKLPTDFEFCFRGSYDVEKRIVSVAKPIRGSASFREIPSQIVGELVQLFPKAACIIDFGA